MNASFFLTGGGEMGERTRAFNWAKSPLGEPDTWPLSLLTTLSILLNSRFPMFLWWGKDHIQFYNDAYRPSLGHSGKHPVALGQRGEECWPEIWPIIYPLISQVLSGEEATWQENALIPIYRNNQLEDVYWTFSYSPVKGATGKVEGVLVVCTETTQTMQTLQKLQLSEQRFNNLVREATIGIVILEGEDNIVELVNYAYARLIGRTPEELVGRKLFEVIPEAETPFREMLDNVRLKGKPSYLYNQPYRVFANGEVIEGYVNINYEPYRQPDGCITGVMTLVQDVTLQVQSIDRLKATEAAARNTAERLELALAAAELGSFEYHFETGIVECNEQTRLHLGLPLNETIYYKDILSAVITEDKEEKDNALNNAVRRHIAYNAEYRVKWPDGRLRWIRAAGNPVYDAAGKPEKMVGVTIDITEQRSFTEELARQVQERTLELQRSNDDLLQFAHVTSHDLKEPVRKIKIWSDRLRNESRDLLTEKGKFYLERLQHANERIQWMIDGILTFSSASSSDQQIDQVDLNQLIDQVEHDLEFLIQEKQAVIQRDKLPAIEGAGILLYQLFYNLINNALKFSRSDLPPIIRIQSMHEHKDGIGYVSITVTDNGIGFNNRYSQKIFQAFSRLNSKDSYEGTGLGLALCQKIVERHGGTITSSGQEGEGATFAVLLPVQQTNKTIYNLLSRIQ